MKKIKKPLALAIALISSQALNAQAPSSSGDSTAAGAKRTQIEEITVTARRRSESLMDVPVSVSSITADELEANVATDLSKVAELAPQVMIGRNTNGTGGILTIRGISSSATDAGLDQSVLVTMDSVPLSRGRVVNTNVYDLAQVEILQGPQALFFGKNSPAGVISMRSADPTDYFEMYAKIGYEFEAEERFLESAVSGPLSDTVSGRLALRVSSMEGWIDNVAEPVPNPLNPEVLVPGATYGDTGPEGENYSGRLSFLWEPSNDFTAKLKLTYDEQKLNAMDAYNEIYCSGSQSVPSVVGIPLPFADCDKDMRKAQSSLPAVYAANYPFGNDGKPFYESDFFLGVLDLEKEFDAFTLNFLTGYYDQGISGGNNADYTPFSLIWSTQDEDYQLLTQEVRLTTDFSGPLNFMTGLYYETSERDWGNFADIFHGGFNVDANNWTTFETLASVDTDTYSVFGAIQWDITSALELSLGARYTEEEKEGDFWNRSIGVTGMQLLPVGEVLSASYDDDDVSPEATLTWRLAPNHMLYAGYKTGYKSGGISNGAILMASATPENLEFGAEESDGFEVGYKGSLLDNNLRIDITAYSYDYDGLQVASFDPDSISFQIGNAAEATTEGVSGSFDWLATQNLSFNGKIGYNEAEYDSYNNAPCYAGQTEAQGCVGGTQDLSGTDLVRAPELVYSLGADYGFEITSGWYADLSIDGTYTSSYQTHTDNPPGAEQDSYWLLNAAAHISSNNEKYRFSLIGRNLTDEYYLVRSASAPAAPPTQFIGNFNRPREIVFQMEYRM